MIIHVDDLLVATNDKSLLRSVMPPKRSAYSAEGNKKKKKKKKSNEKDSSDLSDSQKTKASLTSFSSSLSVSSRIF